MKNLISILLIFVFASCTQKLTYFESSPPRLTLEPGQEDILFISLFDTASFRKDYNQKKKIEVYQNSYNRYTNSVVKGFDNYVVSIDWRGEYFPINKNLLDSEIQELCARYDKDLLLVMADFSLERVQEMEVTENEDGDKDRTASYFAITEIPMLLYDSNGNLIDELMIDDKTLISSRDVLSGLFSVGPAMGNRGKQIYPIMTRLGSSYSENFRHSNHKIDADYYATNELVPIKKMIDADQLDNAINFCLEIYENAADPILKKRASHNLHHLFRAIGKGEEAWHWDTIDY